MSAREATESPRSLRYLPTNNPPATNSQSTDLVAPGPGAATDPDLDQARGDNLVTDAAQKFTQAQDSDQTQNSDQAQENHLPYILQWLLSFLVLIFASERSLVLARWISIVWVAPNRLLKQNHHWQLDVVQGQPSMVGNDSVDMHGGHPLDKAVGSHN
jgi:hypothetical protein